MPCSARRGDAPAVPTITPTMSASASPSAESPMVSSRPSMMRSRLAQIGAQSKRYDMALRDAGTDAAVPSWPDLDRHGRLGVEPFAVERRVLARGPQILDGEVDLVAQL